MARSHKIDISGILGGGRQLMLVEDEVPIEEFEGISFPSPATVRLEMRYVDRLLHIVGTVDARAHGACENDPFDENNVLTGTRLDVADLAQQVLLSEMPMGLRCGEDCAGIQY
jgi:hypothetical protein